MTIANPYDVQRRSTISKDVSIDTICVFLGAIEESIFNNSTCLGWDFYQALKSDLLIITPTPNSFQPNTIYAAGVYIQYANEIYEVIATTTGVETPTNSTNFKRPNKFISPENNEIWDNYICKIIAISVEITCYIDGATPFTALGLVKNKSDTAEPASLAETTHKTQNLKNYRDMLVENLTSYLERNAAIYPCSLACKSKAVIMEPQTSKDKDFFGIGLF